MCDAPGWDGVETTFQLWKVCPDLPGRHLHCLFGLLVATYVGLTIRTSSSSLKKPFETMEVVQAGSCVDGETGLHQGMKLKMHHLEKLVQERTGVLPGNEANWRQPIRISRSDGHRQDFGRLLPICAHCKRIRDDKGGWNQIELFIPGSHPCAIQPWHLSGVPQRTFTRNIIFRADRRICPKSCRDGMFTNRCAAQTTSPMARDSATRNTE